MAFRRGRPERLTTRAQDFERLQVLAPADLAHDAGGVLDGVGLLADSNGGQSEYEHEPLPFRELPHGDSLLGFGPIVPVVRQNSIRLTTVDVRALPSETPGRCLISRLLS